MAAGDLSNHQIETYKSLISISTEALKLLAVINGGAAVAVLTFAGNLVARNPGPAVPSVRVALLSFCLGLAATAIAFILTYLTQLQLYDEEVLGVRQRQHWGVTVACLLAFAAVVLFAIGCWVAADALINVPAATPAVR